MKKLALSKITLSILIASVAFVVLTYAAVSANRQTNEAAPAPAPIHENAVVTPEEVTAVENPPTSEQVTPEAAPAEAAPINEPIAIISEDISEEISEEPAASNLVDEASQQKVAASASLATDRAQTSVAPVKSSASTSASNQTTAATTTAASNNNKQAAAPVVKEVKQEVQAGQPQASQPQASQTEASQPQVSQSQASQPEVQASNSVTTEEKKSKSITFTSKETVQPKSTTSVSSTTTSSSSSYEESSSNSSPTPVEEFCEEEC